MAKLKTAIILLSILSGAAFCTLTDLQELPTNSTQWKQAQHEWNQVIEQEKRPSAVFILDSESPNESLLGIQAGREAIGLSKGLSATFADNSEAPKRKLLANAMSDIAEYLMKDVFQLDSETLRKKIFAALGGEEMGIWTSRPETCTDDTEGPFQMAKGMTLGNFQDTGLPMDYFLAKIGDPNAQFRIGKMFAEGRDVERDDVRACGCFRLAASFPHADALYYLGILLASRRCRGFDDDEAFKMFQKSAALNHAGAQYELALCYAFGLCGVGEDFLVSHRFLGDAAGRGHAEAQTRLGSIYQDGLEDVKQNYDLAFKWYSLAVKQGHVRARYGQAVSYLPVLGVSQNDIMKFEELRNNSTDKCTFCALFKLAVMYASNDVPDFSKSHKLLELIAKRGHADAQDRLGRIYLNGLGGETQNYDKARYWYARAAKQGHADARNGLLIVSMYDFGVKQGAIDEFKEWCMGKDTEKDHFKALFKFAVKLAYDQWPGTMTKKEFTNEWGTIIKKGTVIEYDYHQDYTLSHKLLELLADQGHADAQYRLGAIHLNGVEKMMQDYEQARYWLTLAANQGHLDARYDLAIVFLHDLGMAEDDIEEFRKILKSGNRSPVDALFYFAVKLAYDQMPGAMTKKGTIIMWDYQQDFRPSHKLLFFLAKQGHADAQDRLGNIYKNGVEKVAQNYGQARYWLTLAVEGGHPTAQRDLNIVMAALRKQKGRLGIVKSN